MTAKKKNILNNMVIHMEFFDDEPDESIRENIKKFITLPKDYEDGDD